MEPEGHLTADEIAARIVRPEPMGLRSVWPGEATHFTPWLAAHLDWLESLGLGPLELVGAEVLLPGFARSLDILARTPDGRKIAIENQYLKADHDHLTRGLAYAVGHQAKALVVVAEDHGAEFVAIADYLNRAYEQLGDEDGIAVFLVRITVERVNDAFVPRFEVLARPNTWLAAVQREQDRGAPNEAALLNRCDAPNREIVERVMAAWKARHRGSVRVSPTSVSVSLDYPYGRDATPRSVFVLYDSGVLTVNRGYLLENGPFGEGSRAELDTAIREHFPSATEKPYYPSVDHADPAQVAAFGDWLASRCE